MFDFGDGPDSLKLLDRCADRDEPCDCFTMSVYDDNSCS